MSSDLVNEFKNLGIDPEKVSNDTTMMELRKAREGDNASDNDQLTKKCVMDDVDVNEAQLQLIKQGVFGSDPKKQLESMTLARRILCRTSINVPNEDGDDVIDVIIKTGIVPKCIEFLHPRNDQDLQLEALWVLTNIVSGNSRQTNFVVDSGAIEPLIEMLHSPHMDIAEQACWALSNCAADDPLIRNHIFTKGIIPPLIALIKSDSSVSLLRNVAWTFLNLCRGNRPVPPIEVTRACIPALARLIMMDDKDIVSNACWALSYLSDTSDENLSDLTSNPDIVPRLVELLYATDLTVAKRSLCVVANLVTGNDTHTDIVLDCGAIEALSELLVSDEPGFVADAAFIVSNIAAGTEQQISKLIEEGVVELLVDIIIRKDYIPSRNEAIHAICNIINGGAQQDIARLFDLGVITALCDVLTMKDLDMLNMVVRGLANILKCAKEMDQLDEIADVMEECGDLDKIEQLTKHENSGISFQSRMIVEDYFAIEKV